MRISDWSSDVCSSDLVSNRADDIARNMSALSARIAPIPGRTVIGIELPNAQREPVVLHEMIGSALFQEQTGALPIILGKNISGDPVIADLAPMPHLLIAGTTGSGTSVGLNAMIRSEERRVGKGCVSTCRYVWSPYHKNKKKKKHKQ